MPPAVEIARAIGATPVRRIGTALMRRASSGRRQRGELAGGDLLQQTDLGRRQVQRLAQVGRDRLLAARRRQPAFKLPGPDVGTQRDQQRRFAVLFDCVAQVRRERIDRAAFDPASR